MRTSETNADGTGDCLKAYVKYHYNYGSVAKKIVNQLLELIVNLHFTVLASIMVIWAISSLQNTQVPMVLQRIIGFILMIALIALAVFHIVLPLLPKSIQLTDYSIRLKRYNYPLLFSALDFPSYGFNDCIPLSSICTIEKCCDKRFSDNYRYDFAPSFIFCTDRVVKVTTKSKKKYYFLVDDPDALIREIQMRMDKSTC